MRRINLVPLALVTACNFQLPHYSDDDGAIDAGLLDGPPGTYHVGGTLAGMWDGGALALRIQSGGLDDIKVVTANAAFNFDMVLEDGASFTVSVETLPQHHTCDVLNGVGVVNGEDVSSIVVTCNGPAVDIVLGAPIPWSFDDETTAYELDVSVLVQETTVKVTAPVATSIELDASPITSGLSTAPVVLALGANVLAIDVTADTVSRSYSVGIDRGGASIEHVVYGKASNTGADDQFGFSVAASGDTVVVGAPGEDSAATGINGNQASNSAVQSGAVYVFRRTGSVWTQEAYLKASNTDPNDDFGWSVAISGDFIAVGAPGEGSGATGPYANQNDNTATDSGAVYVFRRTGTTWTQDAYLKASNTNYNDRFGHAVTIDGDTLAVSAPSEESASTGIGGAQSNNAAPGAGAAYVFRRTSGTWAQEAYVKASNTNSYDWFGYSVALDAETLVVGAHREQSAATGIGGDQLDNGADGAGAAYVFTRAGATWMQQAYIKASNTDAGDLFGNAVAIAGDTLAVAAMLERSSATGVNGDQEDDTTPSAGAVYLFTRSGTSWTQQAYLKASNTAGDHFGASLALRGETLVVAAPREASSATGVGGDQANDDASYAGAAYVFLRVGTAWTQQSYLKASNTDQSDFFGGGNDIFGGAGLALSSDALIVGAVGESSDAQGLDGNQNSDAASSSGAIYLLR